MFDENSRSTCHGMALTAFGVVFTNLPANLPVNFPPLVSSKHVTKPLGAPSSLVALN